MTDRTPVQAGVHEQDITLGEVWRGQVAINNRVDGMSKDLTEIKTALATQSVKVGVVWAGLGVGGSAFVLALVGLITGSR